MSQAGTGDLYSSLWAAINNIIGSLESAISSAPNSFAINQAWKSVAWSIPEAAKEWIADANGSAELGIFASVLHAVKEKTSLSEASTASIVITILNDVAQTLQGSRTQVSATRIKSLTAVLNDLTIQTQIKESGGYTDAGGNNASVTTEEYSTVSISSVSTPLVEAITLSDIAAALSAKQENDIKICQEHAKLLEISMRYYDRTPLERWNMYQRALAGLSWDPEEEKTEETTEETEEKE